MAVAVITRRDLLHLLALAPLARMGAAQSTLYGQSLQVRLARLNPGVELLFYDARHGQILANTFADPPVPIPAGSLFKPFLALAWLSRSHRAELATNCRGHQDLCWKQGGHGVLSVEQAIAQSCNAYFLALAAKLSPEEIDLPAPPPLDATPADLIGLTPRWQILPETLTRAYGRLLSQAPPAILEGMRLSATEGTAQRIGHHSGGVLAKTGTAPCIGERGTCRSVVDGLVFSAVPAADPRLLLLTRRRATTGAETAISAGRILSQLERLRAL